MHLVTSADSAASSGLSEIAYRTRKSPWSEFGVRWSFNDPHRELRMRQKLVLGVNSRISIGSVILDEPAKWQEYSLRE